MQHYGSKAARFAIAIQLGEAGPGEIEAHLHDVLDVRLGALPPEAKALVRVHAHRLHPALSLRRQGVEPRRPLSFAGRVRLLLHDIPARRSWTEVSRAHR